MKKKIPKMVDKFYLPEQFTQQDFNWFEKFFNENKDKKILMSPYDDRTYEVYIHEEESDEEYNKRLMSERVTNKMMLQTARKQIEYYTNKIKELESEEENTKF